VFDLCESGRSGPVFEGPCGQRLSGAGERQTFVLVAPAVWKQAQRVSHLVIDFETVAVRIGEINAALADMVEGALDLDALCEQVRVGVAQCGVAVDLKGNVHEPELGDYGDSLRAAAGRGPTVAARHSNSTVI